MWCVILLHKIRRLKLSLQYKETQHSHESKKREKEYERLKQKLGQVCLYMSPSYTCMHIHPVAIVSKTTIILFKAGRVSILALELSL